MADLTQLIREQYSITCTDLQPLSGGLIHGVYRIATPSGYLVVKHYNPDWTYDSLAETVQAQIAARQGGHPVPRILPARSGSFAAREGDRLILLFECAPGDRIEAAAVTADQAARAGAALGRLHRTLEALPADGAAPLIPAPDQIRQRCEQVAAAARASQHPTERDRLAMEGTAYRLAALERRPIDPDIYQGMTFQVVHGDYHPGNLLYEQDVSAILDWDFSRPNWRELEVARGAVEFSVTGEGALDIRRVDRFIAAYQSEAPLTLHQRQYMFRLWFNYLLFSLYPLPLYYQAGAALPSGSEALARKRHQVLLLLDSNLDLLEKV